MANKIYAFWESKDSTIPAYLELCKQTWIKNIPEVELHIINHKNLKDYIGDIYDVDKLKKISLPMQSDIVSAAVLEKFGGLFLDLDCIITNNIFNYLEELPADKLIGFGYPHKGIHLAVLYSKNPNNIVLKKWREEAQKKLNELPSSYGWDFFGNSIINPMIQDEKYKDYFLIMDRAESGNILESKALLNATWKNSKEFYENFYFNKYIKYNQNMLDLVDFGVISLHNSWSPKEVKFEKNINNFFELNLPICKILKDVLSGHYKENTNNIFLISTLLIERIKKEKIENLTIRKIKNLLVLDFKLKDIYYAFDISVDNNIISVDFLVRNNFDILNFIKNNNVVGGIFINNKANIFRNNNMVEALNKIFSIVIEIKKIG